MFSTIFLFEVKRLLKSISTYIYFLILFLVTFFLCLLIGGAFKDILANMAGEKIFANSPALVDGILTTITGWVGAIIVVAVIGNAILKDFQYNTHNIIFTTPVSKFDYLFGRFAGAVVICLLILTGPALGMMLAYCSPWINPDKIGAFSMLPYIANYWQTVIPNALLQGAIFFAVSLISRDIFIIWVSLIIFWVGVGLSGSFASSLQYETLAALIDPLGTHAKRAISKYWSTYDKNHMMYKMQGAFLLNRLLWLSVALITFIFGFISFSFTSAPRRLSFGKKKVSEHSGAFVLPTLEKISLPTVQQSFTTGAHLKILWGLSLNECKTLWRNVYFRVILLIGMFLLLMSSFQMGKIFDTTVYPVTYIVVESLGGIFQIFVLIISIFFSGEIVWRARESRMDNILDALPVPNWVYYVSKLAGLFFMQVILLSIIVVSGVMVQAAKGYFHFELLLYIQYAIGFNVLYFWLLTVLFVFISNLVSNKYVGYFICILFFLWNSSFAGTVLKHNLFVFNSDPGIMYSDMNGFGHFIFPYFVYKLYWGGFALCLAAISSLLWARGSEAKLKFRLRQVDTGAKMRTMALVVIGLIIFIGCGSFIFYNTNTLNKHMSSFKIEELQASYEKKFKKFEDVAQPKITGVFLKVDIFPSERGLHTVGTYMLQNKSQKAIDSIHVLIPSNITIKSISFSGSAKLVLNDSDFQDYRIYKLEHPLAAGDSILLSFTLDLVTKGFTHDMSTLEAPLYNGTFMNNTQFLPHIGYSKDAEMGDNNQRKKHNMPFRPVSNPIHDTAAYSTNVFTSDADFIDFDITVSTVPDQMAVAPGYLQKEWTENGRRYFHYKMDKKILNFYSILSARYNVKKEKWNNIDLEIFYQKGHEYNLERMFNGMKAALQYYTTNFSPYQHKQVRILEYPRYATFAQSFPNTIPFSEGIGFIAAIDDSSKEDIDYVYYVTAHEVGHQWWAHQVIGADVEGSNMMSESFAEYSAITVLEKQIGTERMRKFIHIDMDKYLAARSGEAEKEKPLALVEIDQQYIFYQKGSVIMRSLCKYIGEDSINHALHHFLEKYGQKGPPYPTTYDWLACLRAVTPDSLQYMVTDGFEKIIMYNNKITEIKATKDSSGYMMDVTVDINKISSDMYGKETQIACNDYIQIGIYKDHNAKPEIRLYKLKNGKTTLHIPVEYMPYKAALDPQLLLIDKNVDDNELRVGKNGKVTTAGEGTSVSLKVNG